MRDSFYTAIGMPMIDTKRLFRNMYLSKNGEELKTVFTSKAVPSLQNFIEARDNLYMWVYNHHTVVYSNFLYSYIFRRLQHNAEDATNNKKPCMYKSLKKEDNGTIVTFQAEKGKLEKSVLFSTEAIVDNLCSDSDMLYILNAQHRFFNKNNPDPDEKIRGALTLIDNLKQRKFLKPWWKTLFEFQNFMNEKFKDDEIRKRIENYISSDESRNGKIDGAEFRSQIAKNVKAFSQALFERGKLKQRLMDGDFYIIQNSTRFFKPDTIEKFVIYLKENEVVGTPGDVDEYSGNYYGKYLSKLLPHKDYSRMYVEKGFYLFVARYDVKDDATGEGKREYYNWIEKIFVFVVEELVNLGEDGFKEKFQVNDEDEDKQKRKQAVKTNEKKFFEDNFELFKKQYLQAPEPSQAQHEETASIVGG
jgi:HD superfamily phosphohydrolase